MTIRMTTRIRTNMTMITHTIMPMVIRMITGTTTTWPRPRPCARSSSPPLSACRPSAWAALDGKEEELNLDRASAHS
jgi:hypothetical protein